jgi:hypothetical protein
VVHVLAGGCRLLDVEADPVDQDAVSDEHETRRGVLIPEEDAVDDEVAVLVHRDELLATPGRKVVNVLGEIDESRLSKIAGM